jgi:hypothetical protein
MRHSFASIRLPSGLTAWFWLDLAFLNLAGDQTGFHKA